VSNPTPCSLQHTDVGHVNSFDFGRKAVRVNEGERAQFGLWKCGAQMGRGRKERASDSHDIVYYRDSTRRKQGALTRIVSRCRSAVGRPPFSAYADFGTASMRSRHATTSFPNRRVTSSSHIIRLGHNAAGSLSGALLGAGTKVTSGPRNRPRPLPCSASWSWSKARPIQSGLAALTALRHSRERLETSETPFGE